MTDRVLERLRESLALSRDAGATFDDAWLLALEAIPAASAVESGWRAALTSTEAAWRDAYVGASPARRVRALVAIADDPDREDVAEDVAEGGRVCGHCSKPIPATRSIIARYCSPDCQRAVHGRKLAA